MNVKSSLLLFSILFSISSYGQEHLSLIACSQETGSVDEPTSRTITISYEATRGDIANLNIISDESTSKFQEEEKKEEVSLLIERSTYYENDNKIGTFSLYEVRDEQKSLLVQFYANDESSVGRVDGSFYSRDMSCEYLDSL